MAQYLYHTYIYKDLTNVYGANNSQETTNKTDFETNYKSQCVEVTDIVPGETMYDIVETYPDFKAKVTGDYSWSDVRYAEEGQTYDIYLLTSNPI